MNPIKIHNVQFEGYIWSYGFQFFDPKVIFSVLWKSIFQSSEFGLPSLVRIFAIIKKIKRGGPRLSENVKKPYCFFKNAAKLTNCVSIEMVYGDYA